MEVIRSPVNSPVSATYQFVANENDVMEMAQPGDHIIPGCSTKGGDESRFQANFEKYAREGVSIADPMSCAFVAPKEALSASDFRAAIDDKFGLERFIPAETDADTILSVLGLEPAKEVAEGSIASVIENLVREMLLEKKSKSKNLYMEPHMHQDSTGGDSGDAVADSKELVDYPWEGKAAGLFKVMEEKLMKTKNLHSSVKKKLSLNEF